MKALDLFCGAGGMSIGMEMAGIKPILAIDSWPLAIENYNHNLNQVAQEMDAATDLDRIAKMAKGVDVVCGGPPCQDFSAAGKMQEGERASLTITYAMLVAKIRPRWFVMENVKRAAKSRTYAQAMALLSEVGYTIHAEILKAWEHGVPQSRERLFVVGNRMGILPPIRIPSKGAVRSVRDHFHSIGEPLDIQHYYMIPRQYRKKSVFSVDELSYTIRGTNRSPAPGQPDHPANAVKPQSVDKLSTRQRGLIQTFPKSYEWSGPRSQVEIMIGNAVPPLMARAVGEYIVAEG